MPRGSIFKRRPEPGHSWKTCLPSSKCISPMNRRAKILDIQALPRAPTLVKNILQQHVVCTPPHSRSIYSTTFARLQCSHSRSRIRSQQHSRCLLKATASTQSHPRFVIPKRLHLRSSTRKTWCKRSLDGVKARVSIEIRDSCCNICNVVKKLDQK